MKNNHQIPSRIASCVFRIKASRKWLLLLFIINTIMAITSNIVDWPWLMSVPRYVLPFTPICSLFSLTLAIWFFLYLQKKHIPGWYTAFVFMGIVSYGVMSWIYYPVYMAWDGLDLQMIGNMFWVTIYALQSVIIASELVVLPGYQYLLIFGYYGFKDYSDRYLGSFIDILRADFPETLKNQLFVIIIIIQICTAILLLRLSTVSLRAGSNLR